VVGRKLNYAAGTRRTRLALSDKSKISQREAYSSPWKMVVTVRRDCKSMPPRLKLILLPSLSYVAPYRDPKHPGVDEPP
jgi:hypothetical protein